MPVAISMVLADEDESITIDALENAATDNWPEFQPINSIEIKDSVISFQMGNTLVFFTKIAVPYPKAELADPCAASILWPSATDDLTKNRAHWIVTISGPASLIEQSIRLTQATALLLSACPSASGVFWTNALLLVPKQIFLKFTKEILPRGYPVFIWVDFRAGSDPDGGNSAFTSGMPALGHMDFEIKSAPESVPELRERLQALVGYVLEHGPVIGNGDTIGGSMKERIKTAYLPSSFGREANAIHVLYERG